MELANDADVRVWPPTANPANIPVEGDLVVRAKFDAPADERLPEVGVAFVRCPVKVPDIAGGATLPVATR